MSCPRCKGRGNVSSHGFTRSCPRCAGSGTPTRGGGFDHDADEMFELADEVEREERFARWSVIVWILAIALVVVAIGRGCA